MENSQDQVPLKKKVAVYLASFFTWFTFTGLIGVLGRTKEPMSTQLGLSQSFMGTVDGLKFLARAAGFIYVIFRPIQKPKRAYLLSVLLTVVCFILLATSAYFPGLSRQMIGFSMFFSGFARAYNTVPLLIVNQYFDANSKYGKGLISFWISAGALGDAASIMMLEYLMGTVHLHWSTCIYIYIGIFMIPSIVTVTIAKEVNMQSGREQTQDSIAHIKEYYSHKNNVLHSLQSCFRTTIYTSVQLWFPYYFIKVGFDFYAAIISIVYPIVYSLGMPLNELIISNCERSYPLISRIGLLVCFFSMLGISMLEQTMSTVYLYIILVATFAFFHNTASYRNLSSELKTRVGQDNQLFFSVLSVIGVISQFGIGIDMFAIGYLMEINLKYFLYILLAITGISFITQMVRKVEISPSFQNEQELQQIQDDQEI